MILSAVMTGLAANLATITGLRVHTYPVENPTVPCAYPNLPDEIDFDQAAARGSDGINIPVDVLVQSSTSKAGVAALVPYLDGAGAKSIKAAIEADKTLGGACSSLQVVSATPQMYEIPGQAGQFAGARFLVNVLGNG